MLIIFVIPKGDGILLNINEAKKVIYKIDSLNYYKKIALKKDSIILYLKELNLNYENTINIYLKKTAQLQNELDKSQKEIIKLKNTKKILIILTSCLILIEGVRLWLR